MKFLHKTLLLSAACVAAAPALAYDAGDVIVRAGIASVMPDSSTSASLAPFALDVEDNTQLGLTATYMLTPQFGIELLAATPFEHDITSAGATIATTKHLPPTVSVQWFPLAHAMVQPYVGAGLNYTVFFSEELNAAGQAATGASTISLSDSVGLALEAGVDIKVTDTLVVNASVWKVDIDTDVSLNGSKVGKVAIDPWAAMIGIGMKF